jgi:hypothetical protein
LAGKNVLERLEDFLKELLLKRAKNSWYEKSTRMMTIAGIFLSGMYLLSHVHRFGVLPDFNFWLRRTPQ